MVAPDCGRIVNPLLVDSQVIGGVTQGIGFALCEQQLFDHRLGHVLNADLEEYLVPTVSDTCEIVHAVVDIPDLAANPLGRQGHRRAAADPGARRHRQRVPRRHRHPDPRAAPHPAAGARRAPRPHGGPLMPFRYQRPDTLDPQAITDPGVALYAGGTDLLPLYKLGLVEPEVVVDVKSGGATRHDRAHR